MEVLTRQRPVLLRFSEEGGSSPSPVFSLPASALACRSEKDGEIQVRYLLLSLQQFGFTMHKTGAISWSYAVAQCV